MDVSVPPERRWALGFAASLLAAALITLTPRGTGWAWGSPLAEARWYLTGLDSPATMLQLTGNLLLLTVPFGLAAARWPTLGRVRLLAALSLAAGTTIELLQWALPLGRVVSPMDAVLNATGAIGAGLAVAHVRAIRPRCGDRRRRHGSSGHHAGPETTKGAASRRPAWSQGRS